MYSMYPEVFWLLYCRVIKYVYLRDVRVLRSSIGEHLPKKEKTIRAFKSQKVQEMEEKEGKIHNNNVNVKNSRFLFN